ncbi:MAG: hypothetical protein ABUL62_17255 [Myxococcales bacterium]
MNALAACLCFTTPLLAHVGLDTPPPGTAVERGQTVTITWTDLILHDGVGYDLDLLPTLDAVDVVPIVHDLPVSTHRFDWVVPDLACAGCYLRVTQVNGERHDYTDAIGITLLGSQPIAGDPPSAAGGAENSAGGANGNGVSGADGASNGHHFGQSTGGAASGSAGTGNAHPTPSETSAAGMSAVDAGAASVDGGSTSSAGSDDPHARTPSENGAPESADPPGSAGESASEGVFPPPAAAGGCRFSASGRAPPVVYLLGLVALVALGRARRRALNRR